MGTKEASRKSTLCLDNGQGPKVSENQDAIVSLICHLGVKKFPNKKKAEICTTIPPAKVLFLVDLALSGNILGKKISFDGFPL
jgi:hypothetical protein